MRAGALAEDVAALDSPYPGLTRLVKATAGLVTYIENNAAAITDYAARWDHGEIISPPLPNPPSTSSSAGALPKSSRCSGRRKGPIGSCRPEPAPSTARCATCSPPGIRPCPPTMSSPPHSLPQPELPHGFWCSPPPEPAATSRTGGGCFPHQSCTETTAAAASQKPSIRSCPYSRRLFCGSPYRSDGLPRSCGPTRHPCWKSATHAGSTLPPIGIVTSMGKLYRKAMRQPWNGPSCDT